MSEGCGKCIHWQPDQCGKKDPKWKRGWGVCKFTLPPAPSWIFTDDDEFLRRMRSSDGKSCDVFVKKEEV